MACDCETRGLSEWTARDFTSETHKMKNRNQQEQTERAATGKKFSVSSAISCSISQKQ